MPTEGPYDVYVSYAREDDANGYVRLIVKILQEEYRKHAQADLRVFLDVNEILTAERWRQRIEDSLSSRPAMLAFISPHYFASEWCLREWEHYCHALPDELQLVAPAYINAVPQFPEGEASKLNPWWRWLADRQVLNLLGITLDPAELAARLAPFVRKLAERRQHQIPPADMTHSSDVTPGTAGYQATRHLLHVPRTFPGRVMDVEIVQQAAQHLWHMVKSGRGEFVPDLVLGVNETGAATAALLGQHFRAPLGVIATRKEQAAGGRLHRVVDYVSLPQWKRDKSGTSAERKAAPGSRKAQNILIVDAKFKSGESAAEIAAFLKTHYPGARQLRFAIVLAYGDWNAHWQPAFESAAWPARHVASGLLAYVAFSTPAPGGADTIVEVLRDGER